MDTTLAYPYNSIDGMVAAHALTVFANLGYKFRIKQIRSTSLADDLIHEETKGKPLYILGCHLHPREIVKLSLHFSQVTIIAPRSETVNPGAFISYSKSPGFKENVKAFLRADESLTHAVISQLGIDIKPEMCWVYDLCKRIYSKLWQKGDDQLIAFFHSLDNDLTQFSNYLLNKKVTREEATQIGEPFVGMLSRYASFHIEASLSEGFFKEFKEVDAIFVQAPQYLQEIVSERIKQKGKHRVIVVWRMQDGYMSFNLRGNPGSITDKWIQMICDHYDGDSRGHIGSFVFGGDPHLIIDLRRDLWYPGDKTTGEERGERARGWLNKEAIARFIRPRAK